MKAPAVVLLLLIVESLAVMQARVYVCVCSKFSFRKRVWVSSLRDSGFATAFESVFP